MLSDREIHRLGLPVRCAALGLPDTTDGLAVLHDWGEAAWTHPLRYRLAAIDLGVARVQRRVAALDAILQPRAGGARPRPGVS